MAWQYDHEKRLYAFNGYATTLFDEACAEVNAWHWSSLPNKVLVDLLVAHRQMRENAFHLMSPLGEKWAVTREAVDAMPESVFEDSPTPASGSSIPVLSFPRRWLYLNFLLLVDESRPSLLRHDLLIHAAQVPALRVVAVRGRKHLGFLVADLYLAQGYLAADRFSTDTERRLEESLGRLTKIVWRQVSSPVLSKLEDDFPAQRAVVQAQIWETLVKELGPKPWNEVLLDALEGRLNILMTRIADRLVDQWRSRHARKDALVEQITIDIESMSDSVPDSVPDPVQDPLAYLDEDDLIRRFMQSLGVRQEGPVSQRAEAARRAKLRALLGAPPRRRGRPPKPKSRPKG